MGGALLTPSTPTNSVLYILYLFIFLEKKNTLTRVLFNIYFYFKLYNIFSMIKSNIRKLFF